MDTNGDTRMLLFKDLCSRLPYGVIVKYRSREGEGDVQLGCGNIEYVSQLGNGWWKECKPYLRPMDDMTDDEKREYNTIAMHTIVTSKGFVHIEATDLIDWLNAHHFDYRALIDRGLAIAVTEDNNPYKE